MSNRGVKRANVKRKGGRKSQAKPKDDDGLDDVKKRAQQRVEEGEALMIEMSDFVRAQFHAAVEAGDVNTVLKLRKAIASMVADDMRLAQKRLVGRPQKEDLSAQLPAEERGGLLDAHIAS